MFSEYDFRINNEKSTNEILIEEFILNTRKKYTKLDMNDKIVVKFWRVVEFFYNGENYQTVKTVHFAESRSDLIKRYL
ncbi:hypothetical protein BpHYR1_011152 [Brachionus plicatilis]|uniref:Uncharacterized protein n=1 Tax=Brachionus plicatilis TaxID=10195 RepID=A0A3M7QSX5_BRAPC|nr:hypothetical protein BpHYR1_011152 [Brachionus plicatilis]